MDSTAAIATASASASAAASAAAAGAHTPSLSDTELGALINRLSEKAGNFPSDNYVSNEASYLHVAAALDDPKLHGGALIGVGPEQCLTYAAILEPEITYIADIRRPNVMLHLVYKVAFETARSRADFVARLTSRTWDDAPNDATIDDLIAWWAKAKHTAANEAATSDRVIARARAMGVSIDAADEAAIRKTVHAFATDGLDTRYSMEGSSRHYPTLGELAKIRDDAGKERHFLASETSFRAVQKRERENRIVPIVADLAGSTGLLSVAGDIAARGLSLHILYSSNVEQYLFSPKTTWAAWISNLRAMPWDRDGQILRVYFDQGKRHPDQREGERTTSMLRPASPFILRAADHPYASWWEVATSGS